jgi:hypothetical protein
MMAYGWARVAWASLTIRDDPPTPLQPMTLAIGPSAVASAGCRTTGRWLICAGRLTADGVDRSISAADSLAAGHGGESGLAEELREGYTSAAAGRGRIGDCRRKR